MKIYDLLDLDLLGQMEIQKYIRRQRHPKFPWLVILNYTETCAFAREWNFVTSTCRGLIYDEETGDVLARPFPKFFNHGEPGAPVIPLDAEVEVTDKLDGCFPRGTTLNLWGGGTVTIDKVVRGRLPVTLVGMDEHGCLVPAVVTDWHTNGRKDHWLDIEVAAPVSRRSGAGGHPNRLRVTVNHHILANGEYRPACEVKPGDVVITQTWEPSEEVVRLVRASLLGDGCVVSSVTRGGQAKYQEGHTAKHTEYVAALRKALGDCASNRADTTSGYGSHMVWAGSREYAALGDLRREWYPDGVKRIPVDLSWMDDFAVAKWLMDDGCRQRFAKQADRAVFATNSFAETDIRRLGDRLVELYGISYHLVDDSGRGKVLVVNSGRSQQILRMWAAIAPHVHPSMRYKLPEVFQDVPYEEITPGFERAVAVETQVLTVRPVEPTKRNFPSGRTGYDITTTTHNYLARGVLVHNSLGILYPLPTGEWAVATRGSFDSEQARHATRLWQELYSGRFDHDPAMTYLFEIIYPANRIVCQYGDLDDLALLGVVEIDTGTSFGPVEADKFGLGRWPGPRAETFHYRTFADALAAEPRDGAEGLVVRRWHSEDRVKLKQDEYVTLHRLITGCTARRLWESLAVNACAPYGDTKFLVRKMFLAPDRINGILTVGAAWLGPFTRDVPEEFRDWVLQRVTEMETAVAKRRIELAMDFHDLCTGIGLEPSTDPSREDSKKFASNARARTGDDFNLMMSMWRGHEIESTLWREIRPEHELPYRAVDESVA